MKARNGSIPLIPVKGFTEKRINESGTEYCRGTLIILNIILLMLACFLSEWVISVPVGKLGGYKKFNANLVDLCTLPIPGPEGEWYPTIKKRNPKNTYIDDILHSLYPYSSLDLENVLVNSWEKPTCVELGLLQKKCWPLFPPSYFGFTWNKITEVLLWLSISVGVINFIITMARIIRPLENVSWYDLTQLNCVRLVVWIDTAVFILDFLVFILSALTVITAEIFFRPMKVYLSTATLVFSSGNAYIVICLAAAIGLLLIIISLRRLLLAQTTAAITIIGRGKKFY